MLVSQNIFEILENYYFVNIKLNIIYWLKKTVSTKCLKNISFTLYRPYFFYSEFPADFSSPI